jgi:methylmalonyl-CoA epimerase
MIGIIDALHSSAQNPKSPIMRVDHIAIVSRQSNKIKTLLGKLGILKSWEGVVPEIKVNCEYFSFPNVDIEIVNPLADDSIVGNYYRKNPSLPLHHIAIEVTNLQEGIEYFREKGYHPINGEIYLAPKLHHIVVFLSPFQTGGLLIELVSDDPEEYNKRKINK